MCCLVLRQLAFPAGTLPSPASAGGPVSCVATDIKHARTFFFLVLVLRVLFSFVFFLWRVVGNASTLKPMLTRLCTYLTLSSSKTAETKYACLFFTLPSRFLLEPLFD
jgi:hypothetical protein